VKGDALADFSSLVDEKLDVVVSNPPYIPRSDASQMRRNVTDYEPDTALFVENSDPLIFYRSIARTARRMLKPGGKLYYEIYELYAAQMCAMLEAEGYTDVVVREDFRGKQRMVCATMSL
jgi:release factor glutamine methyltransferase